jgi:hypothetical protein
MGLFRKNIKEAIELIERGRIDHAMGIIGTLYNETRTLSDLKGVADAITIYRECLREALDAWLQKKSPADIKLKVQIAEERLKYIREGIARLLKDKKIEID